MARELYCVNGNCTYHFTSTAGAQPDTCARCRQPAHWSTDPRELKLTFNDKLFLKSIHIAQEVGA